jgi:Ca-activated chloride channel homolog
MRPGRRIVALGLAGLVAAFAAFAAPAFAQQKKQPTAPPMVNVPPPPPPAGSAQLKRTVDMVALPVTVIDKQGKFVDNLKEQNFHVYEDGVQQKIDLFKREDIPVTMGLVIDNSGSMRSKRPEVNAAALTLVQTSNPDDEVFVVNFNEDYYLDQQSDFTNNIAVLKDALERIDSRGSTALYDAILASLDHLKKGHRDKKVLLIITDGEDNASQHTLEDTVRAAQKSDAIIYTVGLLSEEDHGAAKRAKRALKALSEATGGLAFFPKTVNQVHSICLAVAKDIRNQYLLAYYPSNPQSNGGFRRVEVKLVDIPRSLGKLDVRTRTGYYPKTETTAAVTPRAQ